MIGGLLGWSAAWAADAKMDPLAFYVGDWQCDWRDLDGAGVETASGQVEVRVRPVVDGTWLSVEVVADGAVVSSELKGWDAAANRYRHVFVWGAGGYGTASSPGWIGDTLVFTVDPADGKRDRHPERMVFHKESDTAFEHRMEVWGASGYHPATIKRCRTGG
ncbi:MAG: hypothetical protein ABMB14_24000 [Myxococcota bacterium]